MIIYRIENEYKRGPFVGGYWVYDNAGLAKDWERANRNPNPYADNVGCDWGPAMSRACACLKEQLMYWWTRRLYRDMRKHGYKLVRYEVPDHLVWVGGVQVVYSYTHALPINRR